MTIIRNPEYTALPGNHFDTVLERTLKGEGFDALTVEANLDGALLEYAPAEPENKVANTREIYDVFLAHCATHMVCEVPPRPLSARAWIEDGEGALVFDVETEHVQAAFDAGLTAEEETLYEIFVPVLDGVRVVPASEFE